MDKLPGGKLYLQQIRIKGIHLSDEEAYNWKEVIEGKEIPYKPESEKRIGTVAIWDCDHSAEGYVEGIVTIVHLDEGGNITGITRF